MYTNHTPRYMVNWNSIVNLKGHAQTGLVWNVQGSNTMCQRGPDLLQEKRHLIPWDCCSTHTRLGIGSTCVTTCLHKVISSIPCINRLGPKKLSADAAMLPKNKRICVLTTKNLSKITTQYSLKIRCNMTKIIQIYRLHELTLNMQGALHSQASEAIMGYCMIWN